MKEIIYSFYNRGCYLPDKSETFSDDNVLKLIVKPHEFELKISEDVLRSSACKGYIIEISNKGKVSFYDYENNLIATVDETQTEYSQFRFSWNQNQLCVDYGCVQTVDYYPNCDGEHDRWGSEWVSEYKVTLDTNSEKAEICK